MSFEAEVEFQGDLFDGRAIADAKRALKKDFTKASLVLEGELIRNTPVGGTATLRRGWSSGVVETGDEIKGIVFNPVEYALAVELGRKAAPVPIAPLKQWVTRKLGVRGDAATRVAHAISRKKARQRTPGQKFAQTTFAKTLPVLNKIFENSGANIVEAIEQ